MPYTCFSFPADVPPGSGTSEAARSGLGDQRRMPWSCYSYPAMCFSYPDDMPPGGNFGDAAPAGPRGKTSTTCFRY